MKRETSSLANFAEAPWSISDVRRVTDGGKTLSNSSKKQRDPPVFGSNKTHQETTLRHIIMPCLCAVYGCKKLKKKNWNWCEIPSLSKRSLYRGPRSDDFLSKLTVMREVMTAIHGKGLREGKCCVKTLVSGINQAGVDLPLDVITFFCTNICILQEEIP